MTATVKETRAMIAGMEPVLLPGEMVFCATADATQAESARGQAIASVEETEGTSFVLPIAAARTLGFELGLPMRRITLQVHSALDGVGLTAAVASALATAGIPCNVVAGFHHDHLFVPAADAERALSVLRALAADAGS